eukprot:27828_1
MDGLMEEMISYQEVAVVVVYLFVLINDENTLARNKDPEDKRFVLQARGGGMRSADVYYEIYEWKRHKELGIETWGNTPWKACGGIKTEKWMKEWKKNCHIGIGGDGIIRVDYISPYTLQC